MEIHGYKTFNSDMTDKFCSTKFEEGKTYEVTNPERIFFNRNGYHFCKRLEDTFGFFDPMNEEIICAEVTAFGEINRHDDYQTGYEDMYAARKIRIDKILTREEILNIYLDRKCEGKRVVRFLDSFRLTPEELEKFRTFWVTNSKKSIVTLLENGRYLYEYKYEIKLIHRAIRNQEKKYEKNGYCYKKKQ